MFLTKKAQYESNFTTEEIEVAMEIYYFET